MLQLSSREKRCLYYSCHSEFQGAQWIEAVRAEAAVEVRLPRLNTLRTAAHSPGRLRGMNATLCS